MKTRRRHRQVSTLERVMHAPARVDREACIIHGVKVVGTRSTNGKRYPQKVLRDAIPLYEGAAVFINHPADEDHAEERELHDHFGTLIGVHEVDGQDGLYANLHWRPAHDLAEDVANAAEQKPQDFGLSHNALVAMENNSTKGNVREILRVRSVDLVAHPATTRGLFEERRMKTGTGTNATALEDEDIDDTEGADIDPAEAVKNSFRAKMMKIIDDATMSNDEKVAKIGELLTASDDAVAAVGDVADVADAGGETDTKESRDKTQLELRRLRTRDQARTLLESEGIAPDVDLVDALSNMTSLGAMKKLVKSWPKKAAPGSKPARSTALEERTPPAVDVPAKMSVKDFVNFASR